MRPLTHAMSQSAKQRDSEIILTFTENEHTCVSLDFRFKKLTAKGVILYFLVPRNLSDYFKRKALWDCKGERSLVPTHFLLVSDSLGHPHVTENDWRQNCTGQVFFTFVSNYDKYIANETRNTSLLYLLELSFLNLNAHNIGTVLGLGHLRFLKKKKKEDK